jgi:hypothetical protein
VIPQYQKRFLLLGRRRIVGSDSRELTPLYAVEVATTRFWPDAAPLLKKEWDRVVDALIAYLPNLIGVHGARSRPAFPTHNYPIDAGEIEFTHTANERLYR